MQALREFLIANKLQLHVRLHPAFAALLRSCFEEPSKSSLTGTTETVVEGLRCLIFNVIKPGWTELARVGSECVSADCSFPAEVQSFFANAGQLASFLQLRAKYTIELVCNLSELSALSMGTASAVDMSRCFGAAANAIQTLDAAIQTGEDWRNFWSGVLIFAASDQGSALTEHCAKWRPSQQTHRPELLVEAHGAPAGDVGAASAASAAKEEAGIGDDSSAPGAYNLGSLYNYAGPQELGDGFMHKSSDAVELAKVTSLDVVFVKSFERTLEAFALGAGK